MKGKKKKNKQEEKQTKKTKQCVGGEAGDWTQQMHHGDLLLLFALPDNRIKREKRRRISNY